MQRWIHAAEILALAAISIGIVSISWSASYALQRWGNTADAATNAMQKAGATFDALNRNCDGGKEKCGTLADMNQTLHTIRGTFGVIEAAGRHEDKQLTTLDGQERTLFADLNETLRGARGTIKETTGLVDDARGSIGQANKTLAVSTNALGAITADAQSLQRRLDDPHVDKLMANLEAASTNVNTTSGHVANMSDTADQVFTKATKSYLHPSKNKFKRGLQKAEPYIPLTVKTASCALVPGACL